MAFYTPNQRSGKMADIRNKSFGAAGICAGFLALFLSMTPSGHAEDTAPYEIMSPIACHIKILDEDLIVLPGVFSPQEAQNDVLPLMEENPELFSGKRVLEIGTGSGVISMYAAKLGAKKVVSTDINPTAVKNARLNAGRLGFGGIVEARLVPEDNPTAFSVINEREVFDVIISNPPYSLVLDGEITADVRVADSGDLGFSIIDGLAAHLSEDGKAVLLYQTMFYQLVMVQYAESKGYDVQYHVANCFTPFELNALFNAYTERFLRYKDLPKDAITFDFKKDEWAKYHIRILPMKYPPLLNRNNPDKGYPGFIVISKPR